MTGSTRGTFKINLGLFLAELIQRAGVPDGVFTVIHGDRTAVDRLLHHPGIAEDGDKSCC